MNLSVCEKECKELMSTYISGWDFAFDKAKVRFGCTNFTDKKISLSSALVKINNWDTVRLTILHEIAHAIVGYKHHHDNVWKAKCLEIGGDGKRCYSDKEVTTPVLPYSATCPKCGEIFYRTRKPKHTLSCGRCYKVFDPDRVLDFQKNKKITPDKTCQSKTFTEETTGQLSFTF